MTETLVMSTPTAAPAAPDAPRLPRGLRRFWLENGYVLSAFPIAVAAFTLAVTLLSAGLALLITVFGVLVLVAGVRVARGFAHVERARLRSMLGKPALTPAYAEPAEGAGFWRRALTPLRDSQSWLDVVWSLLGFVTGTVAFSLLVFWWSAAAGGLTWWFWQRWLPEDPDQFTLADQLGLGSGRGPEAVLYLVLGAVALATLPLVTRLCAQVHGSLAHVLLSSRAELQQEVRRVEGGRVAARAAEASSLRRLERDIHDGPQQRLVRLTMDLGRAKRLVATDPARAGETIDEALRQARETGTELRSLSRGIAPPLLVDRGLVAALGELTQRAEVPVEALVEVPDDLAPHVETAVYFVVAEALTNVAKHSGASRVSLGVWLEDRVVHVRVEDDGVGGAHPSKGAGLAGLEQRLRAADGTLELTSPAGGPTVLHARLPSGVA